MMNDTEETITAAKRKKQQISINDYFSKRRRMSSASNQGDLN